MKTKFLLTCFCVACCFTALRVEAQIDYKLVCVDSVWYESADSVNVRLFNGNTDHLNYPSVQAVSLLGDTVINPANTVIYYAHLGNTYETSTVIITDSTITDFTKYTFFVGEFFGDSIAMINWCNPVGIVEKEENEIVVYPNPVTTSFTLQLSSEVPDGEIIVSDILGKELIHKKLTGIKTEINRGNLTSGIYFAKVMAGGKEYTKKLILE